MLGGDNFDGLRGPAVFISNHTSHLDAQVVQRSLPRRYRRRVAMAAAADRFFVKGRKGITKSPAWNSLAYNMFPIKRGGGRGALEYAEWLLSRGWSVVIFPEGGRSSGGKLARLRVGPAILAISQQVPVVPMYLEGLAAIRPKGSRAMQPGPVTVKIGAPLYFDAAHRSRRRHPRDAQGAHRAARRGAPPGPDRRGPHADAQSGLIPERCSSSSRSSATATPSSSFVSVTIVAAAFTAVRRLAHRDTAPGDPEHLEVVVGVAERHHVGRRDAEIAARDLERGALVGARRGERQHPLARARDGLHEPDRGVPLGRQLGFHQVAHRSSLEQHHPRLLIAGTVRQRGRLAEPGRERVGLAVHLHDHVVVERRPGDATVGVADLEQRRDERGGEPQVEEVLAVAQPSDLRAGARDDGAVDVVTVGVELARRLLRQLVPPGGGDDHAHPRPARRGDRGAVARADVLVRPEQRAVEIDGQTAELHARQNLANR